MKVLFLSSWFPNRVSPLNGDFVERHALAVSTVCPAAAIHVAADEKMLNGVYEVVLKHNQKLLEVIVYFKRNTSRVKPFARLVNLNRYACGYAMGYRTLKKHFGKPDIIHANIIYPIAIVAWLFKLFTGTPYLISEHWTLFLAENTSHIPSGWMIRRAVKNASIIAPVTENLGVAMRRFGYRGNYRVVPNVVDTTLFTPDPAGVHLGKIKLLHVSSMKEQQKNITGMIRTFKQLSMIRNDFEVTFVGEAQEHQQTLVRELGLSGVIRFMGEMTHTEVAAQMRKSHILILFSRVENLPCVILEALSSGLPVISSDVGGIHEWIGDSQGLLVKSGDEAALLNVLVTMLNTHSQYDRQSLHQYAVDHFSKDIIAGKFNDIYNFVMNMVSDV